MSAEREPVQETAGPETQTAARAPAAPEGGLSPAGLLALQRSAGNRAVGAVLRRRALQRSAFDEQMAALEGQKSAYLRRRDKLAKFLKTADTDIKTYRAKFKWASASYEAGYNSFKEVVKRINKSIDTEQTIANLVYSMASNVAIGALGNALQEAKVISASVNLWGGSSVNTASGLGSPQIPKAEVSEDLHPALRRAAGLAKLDELNAIVLEIAANAMIPLNEPTRVVEEVMGELRVVEAKGQRKLTDAELADRRASLAKYDEFGAALEPKLDAVLKALDETRIAFFKSPWPTMRRAEQDIWILWMSKQEPIGTWGVVAWSVLGRSELHDRLISLRLATRHIAAEPHPAPEIDGGRLGAATEGIRMEAVHGQLVDISGPEMLSSQAKNEAPRVAQYWLSVFLSAAPPPGADKTW